MSPSSHLRPYLRLTPHERHYVDDALIQLTTYMGKLDDDKTWPLHPNKQDTAEDALANWIIDSRRSAIYGETRWTCQLCGQVFEAKTIPALTAAMRRHSKKHDGDPARSLAKGIMYVPIPKEKP